MEYANFGIYKNIKMFRAGVASVCRALTGGIGPRPACAAVSNELPSFSHAWAMCPGGRLLTKCLRRLCLQRPACAYRCVTARFALWNGQYRDAGKPVLEPNMGSCVTRCRAGGCVGRALCRKNFTDACLPTGRVPGAAGWCCRPPGDAAKLALNKFLAMPCPSFN